MEAFLQNLNIRMIIVGVNNHKSLLAEHGIKSLSNLLVKHLSEVWSWYSILPYAMLCCNAYSTPNLDSFSPYELIFGYKMVLPHVLEIKPNVVVSGTLKTYYDNLKKNLNYFCSRLQKFRSERNDLMNGSKTYHSFHIGQVVYMYQTKRTIFTLATELLVLISSY